MYRSSAVHRVTDVSVHVPGMCVVNGQMAELLWNLLLLCVQTRWWQRRREHLSAASSTLFSSRLGISNMAVGPAARQEVTWRQGRLSIDKWDDETLKGHPQTEKTQKKLQDLASFPWGWKQSGRVEKFIGEKKGEWGSHAKIWQEDGGAGTGLHRAKVTEDK